MKKAAKKTTVKKQKTTKRKSKTVEQQKKQKKERQKCRKNKITFLRPSAADQWATCSGFIDLEENKNPYKKENAAALGSFVHAFCENILLTNLPHYLRDYAEYAKANKGNTKNAAFNGINYALLESALKGFVKIQSKIQGSLEVNKIVSENLETILEYSEFYLKNVFDRIDFDISEKNIAPENISKVFNYAVEKKMSYESKEKGFQIDGTADFIYWFNLSGKIDLNIIDLKTGRKEVDAAENYQLSIYAHLFVLSMSGSMADSKLSARPLSITATIIQPPLRAVSSSPVHYDSDFLLNIYTEPEKREFKTGPQCTYCDYNDVCPTLGKQIKKYLNPKFQDISIDRVEQWAELLEFAKPISKMFETVKDTATLYAKTGLKIPGWSMAVKNGHRAWVQDATAEKIVRALKLKKFELAEEKIKSPAQVEKILKKKGADHDIFERFADLIFSPNIHYLKKEKSGFEKDFNKGDVF